MKTTFIPAILVITVIAACSKSSTGGGGGAPLDCSTVPKSWSANVEPIIQSSCNLAGCHSTGSMNGPGPLTNYNQVFNARAPIRAAVANGTMPKNSSLSSSQRNSILCWIDSGAPNN
ncbi:MAG TPA: hypothetical protein VEB63_09030 [Chitinophagaceae bacterium]|nr:hypothetical protein [Chitinophagaceae bacterium]